MNTQSDRPAKRQKKTTGMVANSSSCAFFLDTVGVDTPSSSSLVSLALDYDEAMPDSADNDDDDSDSDDDLSDDDSVTISSDDEDVGSHSDDSSDDDDAASSAPSSSSSSSSPSSAPILRPSTPAQAELHRRLLALSLLTPRQRKQIPKNHPLSKSQMHLLGGEDRAARRGEREDVLRRRREKRKAKKLWVAAVAQAAKHGRPAPLREKFAPKPIRIRFVVSDPVAVGKYMAEVASRAKAAEQPRAPESVAPVKVIKGKSVQAAEARAIAAGSAARALAAAASSSSSSIAPAVLLPLPNIHHNDLASYLAAQRAHVGNVVFVPVASKVKTDPRTALLAKIKSKDVELAIRANVLLGTPMPMRLRTTDIAVDESGAPLPDDQQPAPFVHSNKRAHNRIEDCAASSASNKRIANKIAQQKADEKRINKLYRRTLRQNQDDADAAAGIVKVELEGEERGVVQKKGSRKKLNAARAKDAKIEKRDIQAQQRKDSHAARIAAKSDDAKQQHDTTSQPIDSTDSADANNDDTKDVDMTSVETPIVVDTHNDDTKRKTKTDTKKNRKVKTKKTTSKKKGENGSHKKKVKGSHKK